jgi:uncharacterized protein (TIGR02117 family)
MRLFHRFRQWLRARSWPVRCVVSGLLASVVLLIPLVGYFGAAWTLGSIPVNRGFVPAPDGIEVTVWSNGVHTDLVVPVTHEVMDWRPWFPASDFGQAPAQPSHVAFGWGDRGFFLNVPEWKDLTFKVAFNALVLDGEAAMHVTLLDGPPRGPRTRRVRITEEQYRTLAAHLKNSFALDTAGRPQHIAAPGYFEQDAFYEATGSYGPIATCNAWTGSALRKAGIRTGVWTPFEPFVMKHLPE